jgi:hypothetical protein
MDDRVSPKWTPFSGAKETSVSDAKRRLSRHQKDDKVAKKTTIVLINKKGQQKTALDICVFLIQKRERVAH